MVGHCSNCGKIWTLETRQGVCQWCTQLAVCQTTRTKPRHIKSSARCGKRQAQPDDNGYDQLEGDWAIYYKVARYFVHKVRFDDREDFLHDLMLEMATVKAKYEVKGKPLTEAGLMRVASYELSDYWVKQRRLTTWLDCGNCSKAQRRKCRAEWLYPDCPKAIKLEYLSQPITDGDSNITELGELIADDHAIDLDAWLDDKTFELGCPQRLIEVARKRVKGIPLNNADKLYLGKWRKREQKRLIN